MAGEQAAGTPATRGNSAEGNRAATEHRPVRMEDPSLSPESNRLVTEELREVLERDAVDLPADTPRRTAERHGRRPTALGVLAENRVVIAAAFFGALVVGLVISLLTGSWWALAGALVMHAIGTTAVVAITLGMTSETEHVSPDLAARLEEEGVADPDLLFTEAVAEFSTARDASEAARQASRQRTAITPGSAERGPDRPQPPRVAPAGNPGHPGRRG